MVISLRDTTTMSQRVVLPNMVAPVHQEKELQTVVISRQVSLDEGDDNLNHTPSADKSTSGVKPISSASNKTITEIPAEMSSYWFSREAYRLFCPIGTETPEEAVVNMMCRLSIAYQDEDFGEDFAKIIDGDEEYKRLTVQELVKVASKARFVHRALEIARDTINGSEHMSFLKCCNQASQSLASELPRELQVQGTTVARWYREFRRYRSFRLPIGTRHVIATTHGLNCFWYHHPNLYNTFFHYMGRFMRTDLSDTTVCVIAYEFVTLTLLPSLMLEMGFDEGEFRLYLEQFHLNELRAQTFQSWYLDVLKNIRSCKYYEGAW